MHIRTVCLSLLAAIAFVGCSNQRSDGIDPSAVQYFEATKDHTIDSWNSDIRSTVYWTAFLGNAITTLHLIGVWVDTAVVVDKSESLALGMGAIYAREKNCPQLVHANDYQFIQALWLGAITDPQLRAAFLHAKQAQRLAHTGTAAARQLAVQHMIRAVEEKVGLKIFGKLFAKIGLKVLVKKLVGFVPILGGLLAIGINKWWFMDPISESSSTFYKLKAEFSCR